MPSNKEYFRIAFCENDKQKIKIIKVEISREDSYDFASPYRHETYEEAHSHAQRYLVIQNYSLEDYKEL